jgi:hypothetical protein
MRLTKKVANAAALGLVTAMSVLSVPTASAAPYCDPHYYYSFPSRTSYHIRASGTSFKDGPGGTITGSVTSSHTVTATGTVSAGASISGIVASAKVDVSASISKSVAITVGHTYSHNITARKYGNMRYGSWGYKLNWQYRYMYSNCNSVVKSYGTAKVPTGKVGWKYWETSS